MSNPAAQPAFAIPKTDEKFVEKATVPCARKWCSRTIRAGVGALLALLEHGQASAQQATSTSTPASLLLTDKAFVRLGIAGVIFEPNATFRVQGQKLPGAQIGLSSNVTVSGEAGYYVTPSISLSVTGGVPPRTHATGEGSIASQGSLGSVRYGTIVGLADYHFNKSGRLQPWIGAGPAFLLVLSSEGAAIQNLRVSNRWGAALQVGADYMISTRWGLFVNVTQNFVGSEGRGNFGPYSVQTKFTLNPVALQSGVELRF